jgi:predicted nucleic acid-binding protein
MKIYLDACAIQCPLDARQSVRIAVEAEAVLGILTQVEGGALELVSSEALVYETEQILSVARKALAQTTVALASVHVPMSDAVSTRAEYFVNMGIRSLDALHLASAEEAGCMYFCTCDDRLLRRAKHISGLKTAAVSPLELIGELDL